MSEIIKHDFESGYRQRNHSLEIVGKYWQQPAKEAGRNIVTPLSYLVINIGRIPPIVKLSCDQGRLSCRDQFKTPTCLFR